MPLLPMHRRSQDGLSVEGAMGSILFISDYQLWLFIEVMKKKLKKINSASRSHHELMELEFLSMESRHVYFLKSPLGNYKEEG